MDPADVYFLLHNGERHGPFTLASLARRTLTDDMFVSQGQSWVPIQNIPELRPYVRRAANASPLPPPPNLRPALPAVAPGPAVLPHILAPPPPRPGGRHADGGNTAPQSRLAKVMGILNIVVSVPSLLCSPFALIFAMVYQPPDGDNVALSQFWTPAGRTGMVAACVLGFLLSIALLVAGVGLLRRRRWGRLTAITCAAIGITVQVVLLGYNFVAVIAPMLELAAEIDTPDFWAATIWGVTGAGCGSCGATTYHVILLITMNMASVKNSLS